MRIFLCSLFLVFAFPFPGGAKERAVLNRAEKISELRSEITKLEQNIQEIRNFKEGQEEIVRQTSQTISNQNSLIDAYGVIYTILTILIALIALLVPFLMYQFGIKPSRRALRDLQLNLDKKVADYLENSRQSQIQEAIKCLYGDDAQLKAQAISFLALTTYQGFADSQLFSFYQLLRSGKLLDMHKGVIATLLGSKPNEFADEFFSDLKNIGEPGLRSTAYFYMAKSGVEKFKGTLKGLLTIGDASKQLTEYLGLVNSIGMYSKEEMIKLLDDKELVDYLSSDALIHAGTLFKNSPQIFRIGKNDLERSYFGSKVKGGV